MSEQGYEAHDAAKEEDRAKYAVDAVPGTGPAGMDLGEALRVIEAHLRACDVTRGRTFHGSLDAADFCAAKLAGEKDERFLVLYLDARNRLIECRSEFRGTVDRADVPKRPIVRTALELNAAAVIFAHNHPSGESEPSAGDIHLTDGLVSILREVDVEVLDHVVTAGRRWVSMAERGMIAPKGY